MITLKLTVDETNLILASLGELPAKTSMTLIGKIQAMAQPQMQASKKEEFAIPVQQLNADTNADIIKQEIDVETERRRKARKARGK